METMEKLEIKEAREENKKVLENILRIKKKAEQTIEEAKSALILAKKHIMIKEVSELEKNIQVLNGELLSLCDNEAVLNKNEERLDNIEKYFELTGKYIENEAQIKNLEDLQAFIANGDNRNEIIDLFFPK